MAAGALYGKQRRAQPSTDDSHRLENQHKNGTKYPNLHKNSDRTIKRVSWENKSCSTGQKTDKQKRLTKAHSSLPKAQPPSRAPS